MPQMYKVFINDSPLFINSHADDNGRINSNLQLIDWSDATPGKLWQQTLNKAPVGMLLHHSLSEQEAWQRWQKQFLRLDAAGGLVLDNRKRFLGIFRLGKWDLPKGKTEEGESMEETALREVSEECGITGLGLEKHLQDTWHIYPYKGRFVLKRTQWFLMRWNGSGKLMPQEEEGIEDLRWFSAAEQDTFLSNTYASVGEVVNGFFQSAYASE
ncbi:MAG: NUDIX domain-containing protein [Cryomorphaceae bacterium]|nr:MAG: NUDIX domain-containing protein [Cryomorphaceae bacterium]